MAGRLEGKVAVVTGAGSGMGRAIAVALGEEGAQVALAGRRREQLEETARSVASAPLVHAADVSRPGDAEALAKAVLDRWGRVDVLVNNAGVNRKRRAYADTEIEDWDAIVRTNLDGVFYCTRVFLPAMREQRGGQVINISSGAGRRPSTVSGVAYSASKHGVHAMTFLLNDEEWRNGIRASVIAPGEVATAILEQRPEVPPKETWTDMLQPEDIAEAVRYLVTLPPRVLVDELSIRPSVRRIG
jgi:NADP-dependent 3-hydroxy acid dehydrogenase YdfG